jgi:oligopeptide transport system ATP-binding protein
MSADSPLLKVQDLRISFTGGKGTVKAVDGVDLEVSAGETIGIVGESGCGKSVTARAILRLLPRAARVASGSIEFLGKDLLGLSEGEMRRMRGAEIAMIFQDPMSSLNPVMTIGDQIAEGLLVHGEVSKAEASRRVEELLDLVGIPAPAERRHWYPHQFSGGMRQRAMIALALACNPRLVLADEITTALDVTLQAQILELLKELSVSFGTATIMITHDLGVVAGMTSRVYVMYAGQVVETAMTEDLFARPSMPYTWGLLRSAPNLDAPADEQLTPIDGLPPDLAALPPGCRFAERCPFAQDICRKRTPPLSPRPGASHMARCWGTDPTEPGGWLLEQDTRAANPIAGADTGLATT